MIYHDVYDIRVIFFGYGHRIQKKDIGSHLLGLNRPRFTHPVHVDVQCVRVYNSICYGRF